jgi:hypothetical protein
MLRIVLATDRLEAMQAFVEALSSNLSKAWSFWAGCPKSPVRAMPHTYWAS